MNDLNDFTMHNWFLLAFSYCCPLKSKHWISRDPNPMHGSGWLMSPVTPSFPVLFVFYIVMSIFWNKEIHFFSTPFLLKFVSLTGQETTQAVPSQKYSQGCVPCERGSQYLQTFPNDRCSQSNLEWQIYRQSKWRHGYLVLAIPCALCI